MWGLVADLRRAKQELERGAARAEELAALRERIRLAREMHDSLGHALVAVNVKLEAAQRLYAVDADRGDRELEATRELVRGAMTDLRRSLADLRSPPAREGLEVALRRLVTTVRTRSDLDVALEVAPPIPEPAPAVAEALWRMAQEALVNVERHADASRALVALDRHADSVRLRIEDNGRGLAPGDLAQPGHFGVTGMRERIEGVGGRFRLSTGRGGGAVVEATVPLRTPGPVSEPATAVPGATEAR